MPWDPKYRKLGVQGITANAIDVVIETGGTLLGGIGVSGAPGGDKDEVCAQAGIDKVADQLK